MSLKVLIADDDRDSVDSLATLVRFMGCEVQTVSDVATALQEASRFKPDVFLVDLAMGAAEVPSVAKQFREDPALKRTPLVAFGRLGNVCSRCDASDFSFDFVMKACTRLGLSNVLSRVQDAIATNTDRLKNEEAEERRKSGCPARRVKFTFWEKRQIVFRLVGGMRDGQELTGERAQRLYRDLDYHPIYRSFLAGRARRVGTAGVTKDRHRYFVRTVMKTADRIVVIARYYGGVE